jgi:hypothetical protein
MESNLISEEIFKLVKFDIGYIEPYICNVDEFRGKPKEHILECGRNLLQVYLEHTEFIKIEPV